jgi:hypothetical protein
MNHSHDPIAEIRAVRQDLASRFGSDIKALCDFLAEREKEHPERLVNYEPRPVHVLNGTRGK